MYVSSFSTYVNAEPSTRVQRSGVGNDKSSTESFKTKLLSKTVKNVDTSAHFPINYVSNYKALNNQQKLQENPKESEKARFLKLEAQVEAKNAYSDNSKIFSQILAPRATLDQTPRIDKKLPQEIQNIKEKNLRHTMVNTYISNESYYRITA